VELRNARLMFACVEHARVASVPWIAGTKLGQNWNIAGTKLEHCWHTAGTANISCPGKQLSDGSVGVNCSMES